MKKVLLLLFLLSCTASSPEVIFDNDVKFTVEFAITLDERAKGLMFRESLPENHGMLFVFDGEAPRTFWMKNTLIPLDLIFMDKNMTVVEIKENIQPCKEEPCPTYDSLPAMYVLEINGGMSSKKEIKVGSVMSLNE